MILNVQIYFIPSQMEYKFISFQVKWNINVYILFYSKSNRIYLTEIMSFPDGDKIGIRTTGETQILNQLANFDPENQI